MAATISTYAQCPTVTDPLQSFCDVETPTVANLTAVDNGGGIKWYATATATTPLSNSVGLINGNTYYADSDTGSCGTRQIVNVEIYTFPNTVSFQGICVDSPEEATVSRLVADGHDVQWYDVPFGGIALTQNTVLTDQIYYVDQANPHTGCRTSRRAVIVTIGGVVPAPIGNTIQYFCTDETPTVADLEASGTTRWYSTASSGSPLDLTTPLVDGETYYATTYNFPCESDERLEVTVVFQDPNDAGINGEIEICESGINSTVTIDLFDILLGSPDNTGSWSGPFATTNGHVGTVDITSMTSGGSPYQFIYSVSSEGCPTKTSTVSVIIAESANAGTDSQLNLCVTSPQVDLFDHLDGTPEPGGAWSPALASGTSVFDPLVDTPGVYTYTVQGVPPCGEASATMTVTISPETDPGTDGSILLCFNDNPVNLFDSLGGTPETGGTWTPALTSGTGVFDPDVDAPGVYTYTVSANNWCDDASATVTVEVVTPSDAGINGNLILCDSDAPVNLFDSLGGTPETGGTWLPALASDTGVFDPTVDVPGIYTYTVSGILSCGDASATVEVAVNPGIDPGTNGTITLCHDSAAIDLFDSLGGTPQPGGVWTPALAGGSGIFDPSIDSAGTYTYTIPGIAPCNDASATVTVTIDSEPDAGINGQLTLCSNDAPISLFESLGGTPHNGGTWSPTLASGTDIFDPTQDGEGTYTYTVTTTCGTDTAVVSVTLIPEPDVTNLTLVANNICLNDAIAIDLNGAVQITDGDYLINYALSGANNSNEIISVNFLGGNATINIPASELTSPGTTTFTILNFTNPITNCEASSTALPQVDFNVSQAELPQLTQDGNMFCEEDNATIASLTDSLIGAANIIWYDAPENGTAYTADTPLVDGVTYYASNTTPEGCESDTRLAVMVTIESCAPLEILIPDGFSPNGDNINDQFKIVNLRELYPNFKLEIYNRYGNLIYKGDINTPDWDGTSNEGGSFGRGMLPVGVYFYILDLNDINTKTIQGSLYLNR